MKNSRAATAARRNQDSSPLPLHPTAEVLAFWGPLTKQASAQTRTPFYLFSADPVRTALEELRVLGGPVPVRHWLSCKTQPFPPLLQWWRRHGRGIEVVSEFELLAAFQEGFAPEQILINGLAKHHWLPRAAKPGLSVNFDSRREMEALLPLAKSQHWRVGIRCLTREEFDPENPACPTQFGLDPGEAVAALKRLKSSGVRAEIIQFHLRTNVATPAVYRRAVAEVTEICRAAGFQPKYLDCGGGLPPLHTFSREGKPFAAGFNLAELSTVYRDAAKRFPGLQEIWLENGRFVSARGGVLVLRVLDVKARRGLRQLICDGGRATHALISNWEAHQMFPVPARGGATCLTAVCGPTCMAFDQLARRELPKSIREGDRLVWMEAGAYHLPWETRFSHGLAPVLWHEAGTISVVREPESFAEWWGKWKQPRRDD